MINKNTASVVLSKLFIDNVRRFEKNDDGTIMANNNYKLAVIKDAYNVLQQVDYYEVREKLVSYDGEKTSFYSISNFLGVEVKESRLDEELINLGQFYLHPVLQNSPRPPRVNLDPETNEFVREEREPFYLEIVESFTVDDLLNYFYVKHMMDPLPGRSHKTQMSNLVRDYPLDMVLFLIDASSMNLVDDEDIRKQPARNPAFLSDFIQEARELIDKRKNVLKEGGLTHIVPRELYFKSGN